MLYHQNFALGLLGLVLANSVQAAGSQGLNIPGAPAAQPGSAAPSVSDPKKTHRIHQVSSGKRASAPQRLLAAYRKYNVEPPTPLVKVAAATQTGSVQATNVMNFDELYDAPVTVGTQHFMLDFDTGSADLWVFSKALPKAQQGNHTLYNLGGTKITKGGEHWDISYVDGSGAKGTVYADKVVVGGVTATVQAVEAATSVSSGYVTGPRDGLLGLSFDSGNTARPYQAFTFMTQVLPTLPKPLFTVTLRKGKPGTYDIGFIDKTKYTGKIGYTASDNSTGFWGLHPSAYQVGTTAKKANSFYTIADTGTSFMFLPDAIVNDYWGHVNGAFFSTQYNFWFYPCSSKVPNLSLFINGHKATVPGSYINVGPTGLGDGNCFGTLLSDNGFPNSILGDTFLKSQFVVFNYNGPQLGFAQQKGIPTS